MCGLRIGWGFSNVNCNTVGYIITMVLYSCLQASATKTSQKLHLKQFYNTMTFNMKDMHKGKSL